MKKSTLIGTILAMFMLVLAGFSSLAIVKATEATSIFQNIKDRFVNNEWRPGYIIGFIVLFILFIIEGINSGPNPI